MGINWTVPVEIVPILTNVIVRSHVSMVNVQIWKVLIDVNVHRITNWLLRETHALIEERQDATYT